MASALHARIESAVATAKRWESDEALLAEIRASIPLRGLVPELVCATEARWRSYLGNDSSGEEENEVEYETECFTDDDGEWEGDDLLLKRLTLYFKLHVMRWCNQPPCSNPDCKGNEDGKQMEHKGMRGPETEEEREGGAGRVEMYTCKLCNSNTTFPRYNSPRTLFKSRRGRCGEFANLFGAYCRALGFDTRYISDFTDHVWVEVWSVRQGRWLHADACEGLIDRPNMYEQGWGKSLNYAVGATHDSAADVTKRYTRKFYSDDFQARRREFAPNESTSDRVFRQIDGAVRQMSGAGKGRLEELEKRAKAEEAFFGMVQSSGVWDVDYREGRISGSHAWKAARQELGDNARNKGGGEEKEDGGEIVQSFFVESFYPSTHHDNLTIVVRPPEPSNIPLTAPKSPECITISGVPCATTVSNGVSVVVVDEASGCILQSKAFSQRASAGSFLDTVPHGRIVAICSMSEEKEKASNTTASHFGRLGGFNIDGTTSTECFGLFVGQVNHHPKWATSLNTSDSNQAIKVSLQLGISSPPKVKLRTENNTCPAIVATRLPESIMPLKTQMAASNFQKRVAFNAYMAKESQNASVVGYTTRPDAPIYLIDNQSFPFGRSGGHTNSSSSNDTSWVTYHFLPDALVHDDDVVVEEAKAASNASRAAPKFDVPVASDHFIGLLGNQLLVKDAASATPSLVDTSSALANTRLVALYFSAHWCGPCRAFTPMLIEMYHHLKEAFPTHGLEIVFVSGDRDDGQFQQYYGTMPFAALPFSNRAGAQQVKSVFGVRGIPSLVVLDSLSGSIVVPPDESRRHVHQACQRGEEAIERMFEGWLDRVPVESKSMLEIMALSFQEAEEGAKSSEGDSDTVANAKALSYLQRQKESDDGKSEASTQQDAAALIKEIFSQLVAKGMAPNAAAAEAIKQATSQQNSSATAPLEEGPIKGTSEKCTISANVESIESMAEAMCQHNAGDKGKVVTVLTTAKKYVTNVQKDPSNPRFRNFRLSNKVFDKITSTAGSIALLGGLGFAVYQSDVDFMASIPLTIDLERLGEVLDSLLKAYSD
ncbi:hypothetical protein ACHAXT_002514 [Thalassiosira profunda]